MVAIAQAHRATRRLAVLMQAVRDEMERRGVHASRTVVLLPYLHLVAAATQEWARAQPTGFTPRFETTRTWSRAIGFAPGAHDIACDTARDLLTARWLVERDAPGANVDLLAPRVAQAALELAEVAAAVPPHERGAWARRALATMAESFDLPALSFESAIARIATQWAAASAYATDVLFDAAASPSVGLVVVLEGLAADPVTESLKSTFGERALSLPIDEPQPPGELSLHACDDASDEAGRAAACVLAHVQAGRTPVAFGAIDRVLTRRVRAMLEGRGVALRDETGWKLSTTRSAAQVMLALRASAWGAATDAVVDWLKNCPAVSQGAVAAMERSLRRAGLREWSSVGVADVGSAPSAQALLEQVNAWRSMLQAARPLVQWLAALADVLAQTGQWATLARDAAGAQVIAVLRLDELRAEFEALPQAQRRFTLAQVIAWANETLEAQGFRPEAPQDAQVVILPFNQLLGRPFGALVLAGCDEQRLPASPEMQGIWSPAQRRALGLRTRESQELQVRAGWTHALQSPACDLLWRRTDEGGEALMPSALVQGLQLAHQVKAGADPRAAHEFDAQPTPRPAAGGGQLAVVQLSASAYEDLRRCPYRFFALRQLGLQEPDEIDTEVDKRDFGNWLHQVLRDFHLALQADPVEGAGQRAALMNRIAARVTESQRLEGGEFLPFHATWPQVRDGYLHWLAGHEATGARFAQAESEHEHMAGSVRLFGRIDRIDRLPDGAAWVIDYKTENPDTTKARVRAPAEDTQLAFYAALLGGDSLRGAYVNVGDRGKTELVEMADLAALRDLLLDGLADDLGRIERGEGMQALGEGQACEYCAARGLCRRDSWNE